MCARGDVQSESELVTDCDENDENDGVADLHAELVVHCHEKEIALCLNRCGQVAALLHGESESDVSWAGLEAHVELWYDIASHFLHV